MYRLGSFALVCLGFVLIGGVPAAAPDSEPGEQVKVRATTLSPAAAWGAESTPILEADGDFFTMELDAPTELAPAPMCCEFMGGCIMGTGGCPDGTTTVSCPCLE